MEGNLLPNRRKSKLISMVSPDELIKEMLSLLLRFKGEFGWNNLGSVMVTLSNGS